MGRREFLRAGSLGLVGLGLPRLLSARTVARQKAKACILLFMWGGPAQQDTWDPKPSAPAEYRGEFRPIRTNVPGVQVCDDLPRLGATRAEDWPSYGAVLAQRRRGRGPLPPFVSMMPRVPNGAPRFVEESHGQGAGWLGPVYDPLRIDADASKPDYQVGEFSLRAEVPLGRARRRQELLTRLDRQRHGL